MNVWILAHVKILGRTGSGLAWGAKGPGPGRLGFGLGGNLGGGGKGERGNFMYLYHNLSLVSKENVVGIRSY